MYFIVYNALYEYQSMGYRLCDYLGEGYRLCDHRTERVCIVLDIMIGVRSGMHFYARIKKNGLDEFAMYGGEYSCVNCCCCCCRLLNSQLRAIRTYSQ